MAREAGRNRVRPETREVGVGLDPKQGGERGWDRVRPKRGSGFGPELLWGEDGMGSDLKRWGGSGVGLDLKCWGMGQSGFGSEVVGGRAQGPTQDSVPARPPYPVIFHGQFASSSIKAYHQQHFHHVLLF